MSENFKVGDVVIVKPYKDNYTCGVPMGYMGVPGVITSIADQQHRYYLRVPRKPGLYAYLRVPRKPGLYAHEHGFYCPVVPIEMLEHAEGPW